MLAIGADAQLRHGKQNELPPTYRVFLMRGTIYHFSVAPVVDAVPLHALYQPWQNYGISRGDHQPAIDSQPVKTTIATPASDTGNYFA